MISNRLKIITFNCHGFKTSVYDILLLCEQYDIIFYKSSGSPVKIFLYFGQFIKPSKLLSCMGVKHSNNHSPNIITYHLQYISPLYDGRNATVIL